MKNEKNEKTVTDEFKEILLETIKRKEKEELAKRRKAKNEFKKKLAESEPLITKEDFEKTKEKIAMYERKKVKEDLQIKESRNKQKEILKTLNIGKFLKKGYDNPFYSYNFKTEKYELNEKKVAMYLEYLEKGAVEFYKIEKRKKANRARSRAMKELWQNEFYRQEMIKRMRKARELKRKVNPPKKQGKEENE